MIAFSIIQKSQLEGAQRLDAEYYQPEYLELQKELGKISFIRLSEIANVDGGKRLPLGENFSENGIPYVRIVNIQDNFIDYGNTNFISEKLHSRLRKYQIKNSDILITIVGNSIGLTAYNQGNLLKCNFTENCARVRAIDLDPEFLFAVLISKIGQLQVSRVRVGAAQPKLSLDRLRNFKIPLFSSNIQKSIKELVFISKKKLEKSEKLYKKAEELLLRELGLQDFQPKDELSYVVNFSDVENAGRMDAEYFQPKYGRLIEKIKSQKSKLLRELFSVKRGNFIKPDYYVEKAKKAYIRIKELPIKGDINLDDMTHIDDNFTNDNIDSLKRDDFVFASIGATLGKVGRISKDLEGSYNSNNTARFRLKKQWQNKANSYYLQLLLQSFICQEQFEQRKAQTAQAKITDGELGTVLIPIFPKSTQEKIAELVRKSHQARKKSKELLELAKRKVEEMIENKP